MSSVLNSIELRQPKIRLIFFLVFLSSLLYMSFGVYKLTTLDIVHILHYAVNPEDYFKDTYFYLPKTGEISENILYRKSSGELNEYFLDKYTQPYFVLNLYTAYDDKKEVRMRVAFRIADYLLNKGFPIGKVDKNGCSSIHNAVLQHSEPEIIDFLLSRGALENSPGMPDAKIALCREDPRKLMQGSRIKSGEKGDAT